MVNATVLLSCVKLTDGLCELNLVTNESTTESLSTIVEINVKEPALGPGEPIGHQVGAPASVEEGGVTEPVVSGL